MKDVQNRERTAQAKPLAAIGELQFDYVGRKNDRSNKKTYFNSWYTWPHYEKYCIRCLFCWLTVCIQKINEINQFHMEIFLFKESCNMIGWETFHRVSTKILYKYSLISPDFSPLIPTKLPWFFSDFWHTARYIMMDQA